METLMKLTDLNTAVEVLLDAIKTDYREYTDRNVQSRAARGTGTGEYDEVNLKMIAEFEQELGFLEGKKYIKITKHNHGSVWGFVVKEDGPKFRKGDILKAASWAAPATNAARGNVFDGYKIQWTGPAYL
jgi:hypothetical protein